MNKNLRDLQVVSDSDDTFLHPGLDGDISLGADPEMGLRDDFVIK